MIQQLFCVYDEKAEAYLPPFFVPTKGIATRAFSDCINSKDHQFGKHPADYSLFFLGEWTDHDAKFHLNDRKMVYNGVELLRQNNNPEPDPNEINAVEPIQSDPAG